MSRHTLELEQLMLGELPEPRASTLRQALAADRALAAEYEALAASNARLLALHPPRDVAAEVARRAAARPRAPRRPWVPALGLAGVVAAALVIVAVPGRDPEPDGVRTKGLLPTLHVFRDREGQIEELQAGASARAGDRVQLRYVSAGAPWGVLLSIDGRGGVTLHHPLEVTADPKLEATPVTLSRALELDDAPQFERFLFVTCQARPDVGLVLAAARALGRTPGARVDPLPPLAGCSGQTSFVVAKEAR